MYDMLTQAVNYKDSKPLLNMTLIKWELSHQQPLEKSMSAVTNPFTLWYFDFKNDFILHFDASLDRLG